MHRKRYNHIVQLRREGYRIWKIAELTGEHVNTVGYVLSRAGLLHPKAADFVIARERRKPRDVRKRELESMRATRRRQNSERVKG